MRLVKKLREGKKIPFSSINPGAVFICNGCIYFKCKITGNSLCECNATNLEDNMLYVIPDEAPCIKLKATLVWEEDDE